jgi:hypothetical protein
MRFKYNVKNYPMQEITFLSPTIITFKVITVVLTETVVTLDVAAFSSCMNERFGSSYHLHLQGRKSAEPRHLLQPDFLLV